MSNGKNILPDKEGDRGRSVKDNRKFIAAVMWIGRTGAPWRALPVEMVKRLHKVGKDRCLADDFQYVSC